MFTETRAFSGFAVDDVAKAKQFYGGTLGLNLTEKNGMLTLHIAGGTEILIYPKPQHKPAEFTILNFPVDDINRAVDQLRDKGIEFLTYEGMKADERGIVRDGGPRIAWFADPAGNVLSVLQES